jgi:hypothetical protein
LIRNDYWLCPHINNRPNRRIGSSIEGAPKSRLRKIFSEQTSSVATRAQLQAAIEFASEGDTFVVTKIDRLARFQSLSVRFFPFSEATPIRASVKNVAVIAQTFVYATIFDVRSQYA